MADTTGQWHVLIDCYGRHRRSQLIRRNEELAQLYERIKIQRSTLNKGEVS